MTLSDKQRIETLETKLGSIQTTLDKTRKKSNVGFMLGITSTVGLIATSIFLMSFMGPILYSLVILLTGIFVPVLVLLIAYYMLQA